MARKKTGKSASKQKETKAKPAKKATKGKARVMSAREYEKLWKENKSKGGSFDDDKVPEGIYSAQISNCSKGVNKKGGHYFTIRYVILEGEHEGATFSSYTDLGHEVAMSILGQSLGNLGYDLDDIGFADLPEVAEEIKSEKATVEIEVKRPSEQFQNVYIRSV